MFSYTVLYYEVLHSLSSLEQRAMAKSSEHRTARAILIYYSNEITATKPRLPITPRCRSRHPDACDICSYSHLQISHMMVIAFITVNSCLEPLIEGLCAQILIIKDLRLSVVCVYDVTESNE